MQNKQIENNCAGETKLMIKYFQLPPRHEEQDSEQIGDKQEISFQGIFCQNGEQAQLLLWTPQDQGVQVITLIISAA